MNKSTYTLTAIVVCLLLLAGCRQRPKLVNKRIPSDDTRVVYQSTTKEGDTVVVCNYLNVDHNVVDLPLSGLVEDCHMVRLENNSKAYFSDGGTRISPHYIGIYCYKTGFKLFNKNGSFLRKIGGRGKGPNEYGPLYDFQIDEANNRIYLLPWSNNKLLVYDTLGNFLPKITLAYKIPKATFNIQNDTLTVINMPFEMDSILAWQQTLDGRLIQKLNMGHIHVPNDYCNEIASSHKAGQNDFHHNQYRMRKADSLYHYDSKRNQAVPVFMTDFGFQIRPIHEYIELPDHYITKISVIDRNKGRGNSCSSDTENILINKKDLSAQSFQIANDYFGGIHAKLYHTGFYRDYYICNMPAIELKREIKLLLESSNELSSAQVQLLKDMDNSIDKNDNNILFWGKIKNQPLM